MSKLTKAVIAFLVLYTAFVILIWPLDLVRYLLTILVVCLLAELCLWVGKDN